MQEHCLISQVLWSFITEGFISSKNFKDFQILILKSVTLFPQFPFPLSNFIANLSIQKSEKKLLKQSAAIYLIRKQSVKWIFYLF